MKKVFHLLACAGLLATALLWADSAAGGNRVGQKSTEIKLEPAGGGKAVSLSQFKGKPVLLVFWATWCPPCRKEIPLIKDLHARYASRGLQIVSVGIPYRQSRESLAEFKVKNQLPYEVLWDANNDVSEAYEIQAVPTNVLLDPDGIIRFRASYLNQSVVELIESYLKPAEPKKETHPDFPDGNF